MVNVFSQAFPPKPQFTVDHIPDLAGQVMIVTGGNTGVGRETCKALLNKNAKVYLAARSKLKADKAIEWLKQETGGREAIFLELDLADLDVVRKAAEDKEQELHVLFNNAGVMVPPVGEKTANGYDLQFGTNVLRHYFFTILLIPVLIHTAKTSPPAHGHARVVNTSSSAAYLATEGGVVWETLGTNEASAIACNLRMDLLRHIPSLQVRIANLLFLYPASYGALTQLWTGTTPDGEQHNGKFLIPWARMGEPGPKQRNEELGDKLWAWLEEQIKGH
ncbi:Oxidoreductase [Ceratobasidium theobromae]|uniref:Oxidoreductase n=1 Tax=Ceratobasidium theobromae TaxID=1582974 RepID=A0A5N5QKE7_9AGAM|nr:Oxidoreductase [Ceratobasidium theobromae]